MKLLLEFLMFVIPFIMGVIAVIFQNILLSFFLGVIGMICIKILLHWYNRINE